MSHRSKNALALLLVAVMAIAAIGTALRSHSKHDSSGSLLSPTQTADVAWFAHSQPRLLGDPGLRHATVILGPQTVRATGGVRLTKSQAYILLYGRFRCDHCHDPATAGLGEHGHWHARTLGYEVYWPRTAPPSPLAVLGISGDTRPDGLNLPPAKTIRRLTVIKL
jgi:hypothetical protein